VSAILDAPRSPAGVIVEVGGYKGGSTAKMSRATRLAGRRLVVFDSFAGLPEHRERHGRTIFGEETNFYAGQYAGRLQEVQANVGQCGALDVCDWIEGWFENTMSAFHAPVAVAFIDVDLASSTRTCLKYLYPLLVPGGFSHDGHLPLVLRVLRDDAFWENEIGVGRPPIHGLGHRKLVRITKPRPH
jgi:O-methyltransferase